MENCVFCKIVSGEIKEEFIYEDDMVIVHKDINPRAKIHLLITTKKHFDHFSEMMEKDPGVLRHIGEVVEIVSKKVGLDGKAFTWGFHSGAKQSVGHTHAQLLSVENDELVL